MFKKMISVVLLSPCILVPFAYGQDNPNFAIELTNLADSCYSISKDKIRIIASLTTHETDYKNINNGDVTVRPFSSLNRGRYGRYRVSQLTPSHALHRAKEGVIVGVPVNFTLNLHTGSKPNPISKKFYKVGFIDISPSALPIIFDVQIGNEVGKDTLPLQSDMTNKIVNYEGGQCVIKSFFVGHDTAVEIVLDSPAYEPIFEDRLINDDRFLGDLSEDVLINLLNNQIADFTDRLLSFKYRGGKDSLKNPVKLIQAAKDLLTDSEFRDRYLKRLEDTGYLEKQVNELKFEITREVIKTLIIEYVGHKHGEDVAFYVDTVGFNLIEIGEDASTGNVGGLVIKNAEIWVTNLVAVSQTVYEMETENAQGLSVPDLRSNTQRKIYSLLADASPSMSDIEKALLLSEYKAHLDHLAALDILENQLGYKTLFGLSELGVLTPITKYYKQSLELRVQGQCDISINELSDLWITVKNANSTPAILLPIPNDTSKHRVSNVPIYCSL